MIRGSLLGSGLREGSLGNVLRFIGSSTGLGILSGSTPRSEEMIGRELGSREPSKGSGEEGSIALVSTAV